jgi:hypothetical protein
MNRKIVNIQTGEVTDVALTAEEIAAEEAKNAAYLAENPEYIQQRQTAYPSLADQLDYIYHNGVEAWKTDIIDPIKARYPKP